MKILIASDSFKGSYSSIEVAQLMSKGIRKVWEDAEIKIVSISDGGEGMVEAILNSAGGEYRSVEVHDPLGNIIEAGYGISGDKTAFIEMAAASGLSLVPQEKRNPMHTSTYGTGELVLDAIRNGCKRIVLGVGGSATNDGGAGFARAIGVELLDSDNNPLDGTGGDIGKVQSVQTHGVNAALKDIEIMIACDVENPLCGQNGASAVFGPQKGADENMVRELEKNIAAYAAVVSGVTGKDIKEEPGMGAAGGLCFSIKQFCNARLTRGIDLVLDAVGFDEHAEWADIVITGEGRIDDQTPYGKVPSGVALRARKYGKPVFAVAGFEAVGDMQALYDCGIVEVMSSVVAPCTIEQAIENSEKGIPRAAEKLVRIISPFVHKA